MEDQNLFEISALLHRMQHQLCDRCRNFDLHAFGKTPSQTKGYLLRDVQTWADSSCAFCALLARSIRDIDTPEYFYASAITWWLRTTKPDIYVHMTVSKNYEAPSIELDSKKLNANRLLVRLGDRFSEVKAESEFEICLAADAGEQGALLFIATTYVCIFRQSCCFRTNDIWSVPWFRARFALIRRCYQRLD